MTPTAFSRRTLLAGSAALAAAGSWPAAARADLARFRTSGTTNGPDHSAFTALLAAYLRPSEDGITRVDYRMLKRSGLAALNGYIADLRTVPVSTLNSADQFAYWVNLYNAVTLDVVATHYPVRSIRDIRLGGGGLFGAGPWKKPLVTVEGVALSLDDIEHGILRPVYGDARVHYAVNCASIGCPNLQSRAFTGTDLDTMLTAGARAYINHPRGVRVANGAVTASKIYTWFAEDFGGKSGLIPHWSRFAEPALAASLSDKPQIRRYVYDWALNDV